jgi:solute carrier family 39 (zinc transporter), member 1/2/3
MLCAVRLLLTQGILSAISAGMLIYAATVEMLAADFILDPDLLRAPIPRQMVALGSTALGVAAMALIGMYVAFLFFAFRGASADFNFL